MLPKKIAIAVAVSAAIGAAGIAQASQSAQIYNSIATTQNNFSMLTGTGGGATGPNPNYDPNATPNDPNADPFARGGLGYAFGGSNRVTFTWTGTLFNASGDYTGVGSTSNATLASPDLFFGALWTAHDLQIFGPGSYSFDTTVANGGANSEAGTMSMTVGANQIGAHMLFDWSGNLSIDVVNVWDISSVFGSACNSVNAYSANCLWVGTPNPSGNTGTTVWGFASTDNNADGTMGVPMATGGPFAGNNANFNLKGTLAVVPVPAAVWLFGSGLLGLVGIARRKKKA